MSAMTNVSDSGTTAQTANAGTSESTGAVRNKNLFAFDGTTISFRSILMTSANGCSTPFQPTRFGPMRTCIQARILRSQYVKYATPKNQRHEHDDDLQRADDDELQLGRNRCP